MACEMRYCKFMEFIVHEGIFDSAGVQDGPTNVLL
jgi:hypothetical protein